MEARTDWHTLGSQVWRSTQSIAQCTSSRRQTNLSYLVLDAGVSRIEASLMTIPGGRGGQSIIRSAILQLIPVEYNVLISGVIPDQGRDGELLQEKPEGCIVLEGHGAWYDDC